ncbi:MAG: sigma-70 family RNA polymerase sigma factor [Balneolales bacterium]
MVVLPNTLWLLLILAALSDKSLDDRELSAKIKNGDHQAFKQFFDANYQALFRFLMSRGMDKASNDDLIQKAFVIIWEKRADIDENKSLRAYLFRTAYTRMLNEIKYNARFDDEADFPGSMVNETPEDDANYSQIMHTIHKTVAKMPEKRRMVFDFCFLQQFSYKEAAEAMGVSIKTIENHMGLALKEVRKAVESFRTEIVSKII